MRITGMSVLLALGAAALPGGLPTASQSKGQHVSPATARNQLLKREAKFVENKGQWDRRAHFAGRSSGLDVWLEDRGIDFDYFQAGGTAKHPTRKGQVISMQFEGRTAPLSFEGIKDTGSRSDYLYKNKTVRQAHGYAEAYSRSVYPGIDLRAYFSAAAPRYDFIVAPNADPNNIKLNFKGASSVTVNHGNLVFGTQIGKRIQGDLHAYQMVNGAKKAVPARFVALSKNEVTFRLGSYDKSKQLVIDPLVYGTYYGGDNGLDEVRSVVADSTGGVYMTGYTQSVLFPAIYGPYGFNLNGFQNAFMSKLQGDAYNQDYAAYIGGSITDFGQFVKLDPFGNVWMAGTTLSSDFPGNIRPNTQFLRLNANTGPRDVPTGGTFVLTYGGQRSPKPLPFNVSAAGIQSALNAMPALHNHVVSVTAEFGGTLPFDTYIIKLTPDRPLPIGLRANFKEPSGDGTISTGLPSTIQHETVLDSEQPAQRIGHEGSPDPVQGSIFGLVFTNGNQSVEVAFNPRTANAATLQAGLNSLTNLGGLKVVVTADKAGAVIEDSTMKIVFTNNGVPVGAPSLGIDNSGMHPNGVYGINQFTEQFPLVFMLPFHQDANTVLNPLPTQEKTFGSDWGQELNGFDIRPIPAGAANKFIDIAFSGTVNTAIPDMPNAFPSNGGSVGYIARYTFTSGQGYTLNSGATKYVSSPVLPVNNRGIVLDPNGNAYTVGTVFGDRNYDTAGRDAAVFKTTPNVLWEKGRLLQRNDIYVQKWGPTGSLAWSGLLGGHANDAAGGFDLDVDDSDVATGSAVAVGVDGSVFVTGISRSGDYPRTKGVFGEVFTDLSNVVVTKIEGDAGQLLYSTNLRETVSFGSEAMPAGIAVDSRGDAFVAGNIHPQDDFPPDFGGSPGPPRDNFYASMPTTSDALLGTNPGAAAGNAPNVVDWMEVLNPTGTSLLFGSYLGNDLDCRAYAPYVDAFGDVWVFGYVGAHNVYVVLTGNPPNQTPQLFDYESSLPAGMLSKNAFKPYVDNEGGNVLTHFWGSVDRFGFGAGAPPYLGIFAVRDGWVAKLRIGLPSVQSVVLNPNTIPGGLGASTTGTVTLTSPAPANGAPVVLSIVSGSAASFSSSGSQSTTTITIPAGSTTGSFTLFSKPVTINSSVTIQANYQGSFQNALLNVVPWLQGLQLSPETVVGGNNASGNVVLSNPAPAGGATITLISDRPSLASFPNGNTVTVAAGQTAATFTIATAGVAINTPVHITASMLGVNIPQTLTITTASLQSLSFNPTHVAGGVDGIGTLTLNGFAGSDISINVDSSPHNSAFPSLPQTVVIPKGQSSATFHVATPINPPVAQLLVVANMPAQGNYNAGSASATLFIDTFSLNSFTIDSKNIPSGGTATGTVMISSPAPDGGVVVNLSSTNSSLASVPSTVTIAQGEIAASVPISAGFADVDTSVKITASRGSKSIPVTVKVLKLPMDLELDPAELTGGNPSAGTLTIPVPAPAGGLTFSLKADQPGLVSFPATLTIAEGDTEADFNIGTSSVTQTTTVNFTATYSLSSTTKDVATAQMVLDPVGVATITFAPSTVKGGRITQCTVTLQGPAPAGGATVVLSQTSNLLALPASIPIDAGKTSRTFSVPAKLVSRNLSTTVTATYNGGASAIVTVLR
ncbi:MAG TPA: SBBP repeat-containing protein [Fimbriimonas sp.]|nr:SBBP repeat-containing protein [Fimbriimonas sp.]